MLYSETEIYLDSINLLLHRNDDNTVELVQSVLTIIADQNSNTTDRELGTAKLYKNILKKIIVEKLILDDEKELQTLLLKYKDSPIIDKDPGVYKLLENIFKNNKLDNLKLDTLSKRLQNIVLWDLSNQQTRKLFGYLNRCADMTSVDDQTDMLVSIRETAQHIEENFEMNFTNKSEGVLSKAIESIDFTKKDDLKSTFQQYEERINEGAMITGLQGLNKAFGKHGGPVQGQTIVFAADSHNYKSGMLKSIPVWISQYNTPKVREDGKENLVLFISVEEEGYRVFRWWYEKLCTIHGIPIKEDISEEELVDFVYKEFNRVGFRFKFLRFQPIDFGYEELKEIMAYYSTKYHIIDLVIDYMGEMRRGPAGGRATISGDMYAFDDLYRNVTGLTKAYGSRLFTGHQLNREAEKLKHNNSNIVKKYNGSHMADTKGVQRIVDTLFFNYIEEDSGGQKYLTVKQFKDRIDDKKPEKDKYFAYAFTPDGILDDINGKNMSVKDIYSQGFDNKAQKETISVASAF